MRLVLFSLMLFSQLSFAGHPDTDPIVGAVRSVFEKGVPATLDNTPFNTTLNCYMFQAWKASTYIVGHKIVVVRIGQVMFLDYDGKRIRMEFSDKGLEGKYPDNSKDNLVIHIGEDGGVYLEQSTRKPSKSEAAAISYPANTTQNYVGCPSSANLPIVPH